MLIFIEFLSGMENKVKDIWKSYDSLFSVCAKLLILLQFYFDWAFSY